MRKLEDGEALIEGPDEVLRRQVSPALYQEGTMMKAAFSDDQTLWLSTLRDSVTPEEAYRRWTEDDGNESIGTFGIEVGFALSLGLPSVDDSEHLGIPDHASVVMEDLTNSRREKLARKLRDAAAERGPLFTPPTG